MAERHEILRHQNRNLVRFTRVPWALGLAMDIWGIEGNARIPLHLNDCMIHRPFAQVNSPAEQLLLVQFCSSSRASPQSASPSQTQDCGMHLLLGGRSFLQANWKAEQFLSAETKADKDSLSFSLPFLTL